MGVRLGAARVVVVASARTWSLLVVTVVIASASLTRGVNHLGVLSQLERDHGIAGRLQRHALSATPACISRNRVRTKVALARREAHEGLGERVVLAVGTKEAGCVLVTGEDRARVSRERARQVGCVAWAYVGRSLGDEILVLCKGTQAGGRSAGVARGQGLRWRRRKPAAFMSSP